MGTRKRKRPTVAESAVRKFQREMQKLVDEPGGITGISMTFRGETVDIAKRREPSDGEHR